MAASILANIPITDNHENKISMKSSELTRLLESQKSFNKLSLPDLFFGDEGAFEITKFLQENKNYAAIELRGNNISALGFEAICNSLKGLVSLKKISAEWNNIGSENLGIIALNEFMQSNNTVLSLDLRNNHIGPSCAGAISNIIRDSSSLKTLDLRWNELGDEGAKLILLALQDNPGKVQVDLSGNKISHEISIEFDTIANDRPTQRGNQSSSTIRDSYRPTEISQHYKSTPHTPQRSVSFNKENLRTENASSKDHSYPGNENPFTPGRNILQPTKNINVSPLGGKRLAQSQNFLMKPKLSLTNFPSLSTNRSQISTSFLTSSEVSSYNPENDIKEIKEKYVKEAQDVEDKFNAQIQMHLRLATIIYNLEKNLQEEKNQGEIKEAKILELTTNVNNEAKRRQEVELNYNQILEELHQRDHHLVEVNFELEQLRSQNLQMGKAIEELKYCNAEIHEEFQRKIDETDHKYKNDIAILTANNDELRNHIEKMQLDFNHQLHKIHTENESILRSHEEKINNAILATTELAEELKKKQNEIDQLQKEHVENIKKAFEQGRSEEFQKAQKAIFDLDQELRSLQSENEKANIKNEDLLKDLDQINKQRQTQQRQLEEEIHRLSEDKHKFEMEVQILSRNLQSQKDEMNQKGFIFESLEKENHNLKLDLAMLKEEQNDYIEKLKKSFDLERQRAESNATELNKKINNLERELKEAKDENMRIAGEYDNLGNMLKGNISKLISQTFNDHEKLKTPIKPHFDSKF